MRPVTATAGQLRGKAQVPPERRAIRLCPDHGHRLPLWENSTPTWDVGYTTSPETYGLSAEARARMSGQTAPRPIGPHPGLGHQHPILAASLSGRDVIGDSALQNRGVAHDGDLGVGQHL